MAAPLKWTAGEGYDIHLLRGGPASKKLIDALDLESSQKTSVTFVHNLLGSVDQHGVSLDVNTGVVTALTQIDPSFPKVNNFLLSAILPDPPDELGRQTVIRIHIHDSVKDIWLTPPTLTIHEDADECRFTVLARFNDDAVGDITDWAGLTYQSDDESVVTVSGAGVLKAEASSGSASVTAELKLDSPVTEKTSAPAKVLAGPSWADLAKAATVGFVAGRVVPNLADPDSEKPDSVKSVVESATNILFIAEGFQDEQRFDYRNIVNTIARVMRGEEGAFAPAFQPFGLLKNSINFWTVFVPSQQDGTTALDEYFFTSQSPLTGYLVRPPTPPADDATTWNFRQLFYEVGLPTQADATRTLSELVADWQQLYGSHVTEQRVSGLVKNDWKIIPFHSPLNERNTAFGLASGNRPLASEQLGQVVAIRLSSRRTSNSSFHDFVDNLSVSGFPIGARWKKDGPDSMLVCFVCLSDRQGGLERGTSGFFSVATGKLAFGLNLKTAPDSGLDIETGPVKSTYRHLLASTFAHELAHAFSLGEEYGDGAGTDLPNGSDKNPGDINAQAKVVIAPDTGADPPAYDTTKISWLHPRITAAGVLAEDLAESNISDMGIRIPLRKSDSKNFAINDVVRFWQPSMIVLPASSDLLSKDFFRVTAIADDAVTIVPVNVNPGSNATTDIAMNTFNKDRFLEHLSAGQKYSLIRPLRVGGTEVKLVADPILRHIETSKGPLNAPKDNPVAACVVDPDQGASVMTPTNLPNLSRIPRTKADIIGIYEGGAVFDCGVFRPAGRCRMRHSNTVTVPFCHLCRYVIVDRVDPARHRQLDKLYPEVSV